MTMRLIKGMLKAGTDECIQAIRARANMPATKGMKATAGTITIHTTPTWWPTFAGGSGSRPR